jgi:hypothetical protein
MLQSRNGLTAQLLAACARAGNSKLVVQSAEVRDATGALDAAPGTEAGAVLTLWNPDESWARDALLRVNAVLGPATRSHTVYEHIEMVVHPLGVHLNEAVAAAFWVRAHACTVAHALHVAAACRSFRSCSCPCILGGHCLRVRVPCICQLPRNDLCPYLLLLQDQWHVARQLAMQKLMQKLMYP